MIDARSARLAEPRGTPIAVDEVGDRAAFAALAPAWERLRAEVAAAGGVAGPFLGPAWFAVYAATLPGRLRLLVAHRGGQPVAILPLLVERRRLAGVPARVLRSLSDDHSQRFDVLLAPADADAAARALWMHLAADRGWDALELRELVDEPATGGARLVEAARASGHPTASWPAMRSPYLALPATVDELERVGGAKFRANLRRRKKKLAAELGPVALERVERGPRLDAALDDAFALEAAGWKGARGTAIACDPRLVARYRALAHAFAARGELALYFLVAGGRRVAAHFALVEGDTYFLFKPGFDPALSQFGLGHLLVDEVARDLVPRGVRELDFLGDEMPWKREWTERARPHVWRYAFARTAFGRALAAWKFHLAPALKELTARLRRR